MNASLARRAHELFQQAVELDGAARARFIQSACSGDPVLHGHLAGLLSALHRSGEFLESPVRGAGGDAVSRSPFAQSDTVRNYRILRVIGAGGMATVYEAVQEQPRRRVALKVLRHGLARTSAVQRFQFETEVLARLQHPGIAQIFDAGAHVDDHGLSLPYLVMEYIPDACTITAYAAQHSLSIRDRLTLFATVCDAVQHGHQHGVIHRDLKPGNILMDADGRPKVIDFGVARASDPALAWITRDAGSGQLVGTLHYMSPEQCAAGGDVDIRADVYSLGVILYELLCARLPHDLSQTPLADALRVIRESSPLRPAAVDPRLRGDLDAVTLKAIEKDPNRRYPTAAALAADLRRHLRGEPVEARPPTLSYRAARFVHRHRVLVGAACIVTLAVVGGAGLSGVFAIQTWRESQRRAAAERSAIAERDAARWQAYVASVAAALAAIQTQEYPHARTQLSAAPPEYRGWEWRFLDRLVAGDERTIPAHDDMVFGFATNADVSRIATGSRDGSLRIWDAATGERVADSEGTPGAAIHGIAFSPDGQRLVTSSADRTLRIWDARTGQSICTLAELAVESRFAAWGRDGQIASASTDGVAFLRDAASGTILRTFDDQPGGVHGVAFSPDGARLVTWNSGGAVWLRSGDGEILRKLSFDGRIDRATISFDNTLVAAGGVNSRLIVWHAITGEPLHEFITSDGASNIRALAFSPDGELLASGQIARTIVLYSLSSGQRLRTLHGHAEAVSGLAFDAAGRKLLSTSWDRTIRIWSINPENRAGFIGLLHGHQDHVLSVAFSPAGGLLASASRDHCIRLWDPQTGSELGTLVGHAGDVSSVAFAPDGEWLASGSYDRSIRLWNVRTGAAETPPFRHAGEIWAVAFSPDGRQLASAGDDDTIRIWDLRSGRLLRTLSGHTARVNHIAISPDGALLASASRDHSVRIWNVQSGVVERVLTDHESDVFAVLFSRDGRWLFSGSRDQSVRVWDTATGRCERALTGHGQFITCLTLLADGTRLAAGSWFGEVVLWDVPRLEWVASFKASSRPIRGIAFSPDGSQLAIGSYEGTLRLFDAADAAGR